MGSPAELAGIPKFVVRLITVRHRESVFNRGEPTELTLLEGGSVVSAPKLFSRQESDQLSKR
jgi:hypothetical protein